MSLCGHVADQYADEGEGALDHDDGHHRRHHADAERGSEGDRGKPSSAALRIS